MRAALLLSLLVSPLAVADDAIKVHKVETLNVQPEPTVIKAGVNETVELKADGQSDEYGFAACNPRCVVRRLDGKSVLFTPPAGLPGDYTVIVYTKPGEFVRVVVRIEPPQPMPPTPPQPSGSRYQGAYDKSTGKDKLPLLIELYKQAQSFAQRSDVATVGDLAGRLHEAAESLMPGDVLKPVRSQIVAELSEKFPDDVPLTATLRGNAAAFFADVEAELKRVK